LEGGKLNPYAASEDDRTRRPNVAGAETPKRGGVFRGREGNAREGKVGRTLEEADEQKDGTCS